MDMLTIILAVGVSFDGLSAVEISVVGPYVNPFARRSRLIASPTVQDALKLSARQRADIDALRLKLRDDVGVSPIAIKLRIDDARFDLVIDENDQVVAEILDAEQLKLIGQFQLQSLGSFSIFRLGEARR